MFKSLLFRVSAGGPDGPQQQQPRPRDTIILVTDGIANILPVHEVTAEYIRAGKGADVGDFPRVDLFELPTAEGARLWVAHCTLAARIEADQVRQLRDNAIMSSLFRDDGPDLRRTPWQLWALVFVAVIALAWGAA